MNDSRTPVQPTRLPNAASLDGVAEAAVPVAEVGDAVTVTVSEAEAVEETELVEVATADEEAVELVDKGDMSRSMTCITPLFVNTFGLVSSASLK